MLKLNPNSLRLLAASLLAGAVALSTSLPAHGLVSDDFHACAPDPGIWTLVDPLGDASLEIDGAGSGDARLALGVPEGPSHDAWLERSAPRLLQDVADADFRAIAKFDSVVEQRYQDQGLVVEGLDQRWLRFDVYSDGNAAHLFAATFAGGAPTVRLDRIVSPAAIRLLGVERVGDEWILSHSSDGGSWNEAVRFPYAMEVRTAGPYAGNAAPAGAAAPGHTALVDYFFDAASPLAPEDGGSAACGEAGLRQDFEGVPVGGDPPGWLDTARDNRLDEDPSLFRVFELDGNRAFGTDSSETNIHSHFEAGELPHPAYELTGRMRMSAPDSGIGVTFASQYPARDAYYRLRRYGSRGFHLSARGTALAGSTETPVDAVPDAWVRFRIRVEDEGPRTRLRARVWNDGAAEPPGWQADAWDDGPGRLASGRMGVWAFGSGTKLWDDLAAAPFGSDDPVEPEPPPPPPPSPEQGAQDFEDVPVGGDPPGWLDTARDNRLDEDPGLFRVFDRDGNHALGTDSSETNIHSHFQGESLPQPAYEFTGRMRMSAPGSGIGVTFASQYPSRDAYYRLRRYGSRGFHLSPHGTTLSGVTETSVNPVPGTWVRFLVLVVDRGSRTEIKAKLWRDGDPEPAVWQADAWDDGPERLRDGRVGVWSYSAGQKFWDDLAVDAVDPDAFYALSLSSEAGGRASADPEASAYAYGQAVELTAAPDPGFRFAGWSGDLSGSEPVTTLVLRGDREVHARFADDSTAPRFEFIHVEAGETTATVRWRTDEPAAGALLFGEGEGYELGRVERPDHAAEHSVVLSGLRPGTLHHFVIEAEDLARFQASSGDRTFITASAPAAGPDIDVWYGPQQRFGHLGLPQRWINVLGRISDPDGIASASFSLNGGASRSLSLGPNGTRLAHPGDFNAEISVGELANGVNQLLLRATDGLGNAASTQVDVVFDGGQSWPSPFTADWGSASSIQDLGQVVDGRWRLEGPAIRPVEPGYDRLVALGGVAWQNYEVTVPVTFHGVRDPGIRSFLGILVRWQGHAADGDQPSSQWWPLGVFAYSTSLQGSSSLGMIAKGPGASFRSAPDGALEPGVPYVFKLRCELSGSNSLYRFKVWRNADPEPAAWSLVGEETQDDQTRGSLLLVAHEVDASFGTVSVTPLP